MTTKAILMFHQEFPIGIRKRFEGCRRSRGDSRFLSPVAGTIGVAGAVRIAKAIRTGGIAGAVRIAEAIGTGELRRATTRARGHRSGSVRNELIARWQCFFNAQCATNKGVPGFILDRRLRDDELLDVMEKTSDKVKIASRRGNEVRDLVGQCLDLNRVIGDREIVLFESLVLTISDALVILRDKVIT